jgi:dihydrofolate reductase
MRPLRYSINVTLDGCVDHEAVPAEDQLLEVLHEHHANNLARADALVFGRITYTMMEDAFRKDSGVAWDPEDAFSVTIDAAKKHVVSSTLESVDWNAELVQGDLATAIQQLKEQPGDGLALGGAQLPLALADLGLIDEYELVVVPRLAGRGPYLFAGLADAVDLEQVDRRELAAGAVVVTYQPRR